MRIREVSGGQFHWLMRQTGAHRGAVSKAEDDAGFSNAGYGVVKLRGKAIGLVTRYDCDNPRYFVDNAGEPVEQVSWKFGAPALKYVTLPSARRAISEVVLPRKAYGPVFLHKGAKGQIATA